MLFKLFFVLSLVGIIVGYANYEPSEAEGTSSSPVLNYGIPHSTNEGAEISSMPSAQEGANKDSISSWVLAFLSVPPKAALGLLALWDRVSGGSGGGFLTTLRDLIAMGFYAFGAIFYIVELLAIFLRWRSTRKAKKPAKRRKKSKK